jgi:signal transduction histidine kinase
MKKILLILTFFLFVNLKTNAQITNEEKNQIVWVKDVPTCPDDKNITKLINTIGIDELSKNKKTIDKDDVKIYREIGVAFNKKELYDAADWYLEKVKNRVEVIEIKPESVFESPKIDETTISPKIAESLAKDKEFLKSLPNSYDNVSPSDLKKLANEIESKLQDLIKEKESLLEKGESQEIIDSKDATIKTLDKEKDIIDLTIEGGELKGETKILNIEKQTLKKYLTWLIIGTSVLILVILVLLQRKTIRVKDTEINKQLMDINKKNKYLEYSARIIRHDMHSGINTYIPRGISSLEKRIPGEEIERLKISSPIKMIKEGISHTQKVYKRVYEFTNLVKQKVVLNKEMINTKNSLEDYFSNVSYRDNIKIEDLGDLEVNDTLFCNAIDNLVKNGIQYNDNKTKEIKIYMEDNFLVVEDNGRGLSKEEFEDITIKNRKGGENAEIGLGLSISKTILEEHGFTIESEKIKTGTKIKIKTKKND